MKQEEFPKVLAISLSTWRHDSGIHTQTDLFKYWEVDKLAQIYTRSDLPNTPVCNKFFQISENAIIRSVFNHKMVGREVQNDIVIDKKTAKEIEQEKTLYTKAHMRHSWIMSLLREVVWKFGQWKSPELDRFLQDVQPDLYFVPIYPVAYMGWIQLYIIEKYPKPYVCYLSDDNYSYASCGYNFFAYLHRFILRKTVKKIATNCTEMFTITKMEADDTDRLFGTHSVVLTKGINYSELQYHEKNVKNPIRMVYTGKLIIGRASSLAAISKAMKYINKDEERISLDIYSQDIADRRTMKLLNSNGCHYKGAVEKEKVAQIQRDADIVVFVESLEKKYKLAARLSFSTKLTDYFASGKCIFAVGDKNIAPIDYLKNNDAAIIASEYNDILLKLQKIVENPELVLQYGKKAFDCGKRNHNEEEIKQLFISTMVKAANKRVNE